MRLRPHNSIALRWLIAILKQNGNVNRWAIAMQEYTNFRGVESPENFRFLNELLPSSGGIVSCAFYGKVG
jgi:hypothetical protein